jgi:uncharacterized RDD family membrane protein YckC
METSIDPFQEPLSQVTGKGFGIRVGAYLIDVVVIWIVTLSVSFIVGVGVGIVAILTGRQIISGAQTSTALNFLLGLILSTVYFTVFAWLYGASPGKLFLSMRVVMEDGTPCTFKAAFIRALLLYIDGLFFGLPAYSSMKAPLQQRIGDKSAKTLVVDSKDTMIQEAPAWWWFLIAFGIYLLAQILAALIQSIPLIG